MRKLRKGRLMLLIVLAVAIISIVAVIIVSCVNRGKDPTGGTGEIDDTQQVIPLPETTYSEMEVRNVSMEYLKNNDETMISMEINNTTQKKFENESLTVVLIDEKGEAKKQMPTLIQSLDVGEQYEISIVFQGDMTDTAQIKLIEN